MKITPIISEKSLDEAKNGFYTFKVNKNLNKHQIRELVESAFNVTVDEVKTLNIKARVKRTIWGKTKRVQAVKKAVVTLKGKDKIDIFETKD